MRRVRSANKLGLSGAHSTLVELHTADRRHAPLFLCLFLILSCAQYPDQGGLFGGNTWTKIQYQESSEWFYAYKHVGLLGSRFGSYFKYSAINLPVSEMKETHKRETDKYGLDNAVRTDRNDIISVASKNSSYYKLHLQLFLHGRWIQNSTFL